jgi:hypothetical protein
MVRSAMEGDRFSVGEIPSEGYIRATDTRRRFLLRGTKGLGGRLAPLVYCLARPPSDDLSTVGGNA